MKPFSANPKLDQGVVVVANAASSRHADQQGYLPVGAQSKTQYSNAKETVRMFIAQLMSTSTDT